jgi:RNA-binding protein
MLTPKQRQFFKAKAHPLKANVHIGKAGLTDSLAQELDVMLDSLELMKIKLNQNTFEDESSVVEALKLKVPGLEVVRVLGHTVLVHRASRIRPTAYPLP